MLNKLIKVRFAAHICLEFILVEPFFILKVLEFVIFKMTLQFFQV